MHLKKWIVELHTLPASLQAFNSTGSIRMHLTDNRNAAYPNFSSKKYNPDSAISTHQHISTNGLHCLDSFIEIILSKYPIVFKYLYTFR